MVFGPSGLLACAPPGPPARWEASRQRLAGGRGGGVAFLREDPESLRGPQFAAAWADELATGRKQEALGHAALGPPPRGRAAAGGDHHAARRRRCAGDPGPRRDPRSRGRRRREPDAPGPAFVEKVRRGYGGSRLGRRSSTASCCATSMGRAGPGRCSGGPGAARRSRSTASWWRSIRRRPAGRARCGIVVRASRRPGRRRTGWREVIADRTGAAAWPQGVGGAGGGAVTAAPGRTAGGRGEPGRRPGGDADRRRDPPVPFRAGARALRQAGAGRAGRGALSAGAGGAIGRRSASWRAR